MGDMDVGLVGDHGIGIGEGRVFVVAFGAEWELSVVGVHPLSGV